MRHPKIAKNINPTKETTIIGRNPPRLINKLELLYPFNDRFWS